MDTADWRARAEAYGWPRQEVASCATLVRPDDAVVEVHADRVVIEKSGVFVFEDTGRDGMPNVRRLPWTRRWTWYRHRQPESRLAADGDADRDYTPPDLLAVAEPNVELALEYCPCGPAHERSCELYVRPAGGYAERSRRARASAAQSALRSQARRAREAQLAAPAAAPKPKRVAKPATQPDPRQLKLG